MMLSLSVILLIGACSRYRRLKREADALGISVWERLRALHGWVTYLDPMPAWAQATNRVQWRPTG